MSKESTTAIAAAEAAAERKQNAENEAHKRFHAVRTEIEAARPGADVTQTNELKEWLQSRRETDEAWGKWAMAMEAERSSHS